MGRLGRPDRGADAGAARPPVRLRRARHLPDPAAAVHGRGPARLQGARRGVGRRPPRRAEDRRGGPRAAPPGEGRARLRQAAAPVPPDDRRPQPRRRAGPARGGQRAARRRQDAHHVEPRRLHRHGGDLELLLLADALHERARRRGPRAAADGARERVLALRGQAGRGAHRELQPVPRPDAAGRDDAGPDAARRIGRSGLLRGALRPPRSARPTTPDAADPANPALDFLLGQ